MSPKNLGLSGLFIAFVFALPLFVWSAINVNFNVSEKAQGEPNSCGGTCGSNYNCKMDYFCFEGFCRNPLCSSSVDCVCRATPNPTQIATTKAKAKPTPTTTSLPKGGNETPEPESTIKSLSTTKSEIKTTPKPVVTAPENMFFAKYAIYIFLGFVTIIIASIAFTLKRPIKN